MEQFRKFLRDKAFALVLTACLLAAAAAGVWAVRTVRNELKKDLDAVRSPSSTAPGIDEGINTSPGVAGEEEAEWQQQNAPAANSVANVPKADSSSGGAASSSGAQSGSGSVREPSALQTESLPASSSAAPASTQPVSGRVLNSYSGDELVYSKTLGDWRTHNGVDYAADRGAEVRSKVKRMCQRIRQSSTLAITEAFSTLLSPTRDVRGLPDTSPRMVSARSRSSGFGWSVCTACS